MSDNLERAKAMLADDKKRRNNRVVDSKIVEMARTLRQRRENEGGLGDMDRAQLILAEAAGAVEVKPPAQGYILENMTVSELSDLISTAASKEMALRAKEGGNGSED